MDTPQRLATDKALQRLNPKSEFALRERALPS
jgi:hypothetical protein